VGVMVVDEPAGAGVFLEVVGGAVGDGVVVEVVGTVLLNVLVGTVVDVDAIGAVVDLNVVGNGVVLEVAVCSIVSGGTGVIVRSSAIEQSGPLKPSSQMQLPSFPLHLPLSLQVVVALHLL
jgi:hypothetical protein